MKKKLKLAGMLLGATLATTGAVSADNEMPKMDKHDTTMMDGNTTAMVEGNKTAMMEEGKKHADKKVGAGK